MNKEILDKIAELADVETDVSFRKLTTFRVGGLARQVVYPHNGFALTSIVRLCKDNDVDYKVLGNGSNLLPSEDQYDGVIIKLSRHFIDYVFDQDRLYAQAGCSLISLAYKALNNDLSGLEFASGIPGTLGGAIFMNAGAYKSDMSHIVEEVQVLKDDNLIWMTNEECEFAYRSSIFSRHPQWVICAVKMKLEKSDHDSIKELMDNRREKRMATQPLNYPSAGSTFRNLDGTFAWKLIDDIGYRGKKVGGAQVSEKHSNFIINTGNATADDIVALSDQIRTKVKAQFNIDMVMEVEKFNWKK